MDRSPNFRQFFCNNAHSHSTAEQQRNKLGYKNAMAIIMANGLCVKLHIFEMKLCKLCKRLKWIERNERWDGIMFFLYNEKGSFFFLSSSSFFTFPQCKCAEKAFIWLFWHWQFFYLVSSLPNYLIHSHSHIHSDTERWKERDKGNARLH